MSGHTPGKWHIDLASGYANVWRVRDAEDRIVATCEQVQRHADNAEANSRLIAAAPDLLVELQKAADTFADTARYFSMLGKLEGAEAYSVAEKSTRAAISKAVQP